MPKPRAPKSSTPVAALDPRAPIIPEPPVFAGAMKRRRQDFDPDGPDPLLPQCQKSPACYRANGHKGGCWLE